MRKKSAIVFSLLYYVHCINYILQGLSQLMIQRLQLLLPQDRT